MNNNTNQLVHRPPGVTILGVLFVIGGAFALLGGIGTFAAIPFATDMMTNAANNALEPLTVIGAVLIPIGIASLVVGYGLFKAKRWAWSVAVVLSAIGFAINVISLVTGNMSAITSAVVGMAINGIILYYLSWRNVRQYFGKDTNKIPSTTLGA
jgi:uncharacterized membrane protein (DUF2068 family)